MKDLDHTIKPASGPQVREPRRIQLPGFLIEKEIGLGDVVKRITYGFGVKPCNGCERRAAALNQLVRFSK